jgi:hypothetical protein
VRPVRDVEDKIRPEYARGFYHVSEDGLFSQVIIFEYLDQDLYYSSLAEDELEEELELLREGMNEVLREERVLINGKEVRPRVISVGISYPLGKQRPNVTFVVQFRAELEKDNSYENLYESTVADYGYEAYWIFPPKTQIVEIQASGKIEKLAKNVIRILSHKGMKVEGYEMIRFKFPELLI